MTHPRPRILVACADAALRGELAAVLLQDNYDVCLAPLPLPQVFNLPDMPCELAIVDHAYACQCAVLNPCGLPVISIGNIAGAELAFVADAFRPCDRLAQPLDAELCLDMVAHHLARTHLLKMRVAQKPQARAPSKPLLQARLAELEQFGGIAFISELVSQFLCDARMLKHELEMARARLDIPAFRDHAHALRSCAANVGAQALFELCLSWREISAAELKEQGDENLARLRADLSEAEVMFESYLAMSAELQGQSSQDAPVSTLSAA